MNGVPDQRDGRPAASLAESEAALRRLSNILESITDAFYSLDFEGRFIYLNEKAETFLGKPREALIGKSIWQECPGAIGLGFYSERNKPIFQEMSVRAEEYYPPLDAWFEVFGYPSSEGVSIYFRDITAQKQAERERTRLLAAERAARAEAHHEAAQKAAILEQMADAVVVADADGRIGLANRAAVELFGVPPDDLADHGLETLPWRLFDRNGREVPLAELPLARALRGEVVANVFRIVSPAERERWGWISAAPLRDEHGRIQGAVTVSRDVTEERAREQRTAAAEKLQALGQLASGVAHDLNQYLGLVVGHGELALEALRRPVPDPSALAESLQTMVRAALDGAETVRGLQAFARSRPEGPPERVDFAELLHEVARLTAPRWRDAARAEGRRIELQVEVQGRPTIEGWAASLREALMNLVFNAVDALPEGGEICLAAHQRADRIELEVSDTGLGMSPEVQARAFELFFSTKGEHGTGLGLAMVYGIVERHHGQLALDSAPGRGTTFHLIFPAALPTAATPPPVAVAPPPAKALRALVVDDEPALGKLLARMLTSCGHQAEAVTSGEEALRLLERERFDLVISDLAMGIGMNGWELAARVRARHPDLPFALATGWGAQADPDQVKALGITTVLSKPYRLADLRNLLAQMSA